MFLCSLVNINHTEIPTTCSVGDRLLTKVFDNKPISLGDGKTDTTGRKVSKFYLINCLQFIFLEYKEGFYKDQ